MAHKDKEIAVKVEDLKKSFQIPLEAHSGIKQKIINTIKGRKGYREFTPLNGISFEIEKGDFFGIVGRNGSGKSTLLKTLAGIYSPDGGVVHVDGTLVPFIELGVGFNPELTGRENVFLNGALLGFSHKQMEDMYDDIVDFAELHEFMEERLKNYSSGMQVRLAFSIAIRAEGDILLLDEILAVGDEAFQRKCEKYFEQLKGDKKTVILVTHSMESVRKYCNKAIMLSEGKIVANDTPDAVADKYSVDNMPLVDKEEDSRDDTKSIISATILSKRVTPNTENLQLEIKYTNRDNREVYPKVIINYNGVPIMAMNAKVHKGIVTADTNEHMFRYELPLKEFNKGEISVAVQLVDSETEINIADFGYADELPLIIKNPKTGDKVGGIISNQGELHIVK